MPTHPGPHTHLRLAVLRLQRFAQPSLLALRVATLASLRALRALGEQPATKARKVQEFSPEPRRKVGMQLVQQATKRCEEQYHFVERNLAFEFLFLGGFSTIHTLIVASRTRSCRTLPGGPSLFLLAAGRYPPVRS